MTITKRILAALTLLAVAACGQSPADDTTAAPLRADTGATSTTAVEGTNAQDRADQTAPANDTSATSTPTAHVPASSAAPAPTPESAAAGKTATASVYAPPLGRYVYDVTGTVQTQDVTGTSERPVSPTSTDDIHVSDEPAAMRMTVVTRDEGQDSAQEIVVAVTATEARLVRLSYRPGTGLDYSVNPDPPALLARLPYRDGDTWEIAWNDPSTGISGVGTGTVERHETITTPAGRFDTVVVTVTQRLRGTVTGTLTVTSWIDPTTGVQPRQHVVTDLANATGASRSDSTRTLRERPA